MIQKNREVIEIVELINSIFGNDVLRISDHWEEDLCAIGLQKENKLIYIACYERGYYFYECEILVDDPEIIYLPQYSENNISEQQLLKIISNFFNIKIIGNYDKNSR
jgi:hypothetical protein